MILHHSPYFMLLGILGLYSMAFQPEAFPRHEENSFCIASAAFSQYWVVITTGPLSPGAVITELSLESSVILSDKMVISESRKS